MIDLEKERALIEKTALKNGFKLKQQPNGEMALNPYVFDFAEELLADKQAEITELKQNLAEIAQQEISHLKNANHHLNEINEDISNTILYLREKLAKYERDDVVVVPRVPSREMLKVIDMAVTSYESSEVYKAMIEAGEIK